MKKVFFVAALALTTLFFSCSKDDNDAKDLTKEEASTTIQATNTDLKQEISSIQNSKGVATMTYLSILAKDGIFPESIAQLTSADGVAAIFMSRSNPLKSLIEPTPVTFDFNKNKGLYKYENGKFTRSTSITNRIEIHFPAKEGTTTNNAVLTISAYSEQYAKSQEENIPTMVEAELKIDGAVAAKISYKAALATFGDYGLAGTGVASFDLKVELSPYTLESHQILSGEKGALKTTDNSFLKNGSKTLISTSRTLTASGDEKTGDVKFNGNAFVQVSNLKLEGDLSYSGKIDPMQGVEGIISKINLTLYKYPEGNRIGTIDLTNRDVPMIVYNDGSKAKAEDVFAELIKGIFPDPS